MEEVQFPRVRPIPGWCQTPRAQRPALAAAAEPSSLGDPVAFAEEYGLDQNKFGFSEFTESGYWDGNDVLRPIIQEAGEMLGREFAYPGDEAKGAE